MGRNYHAFCGGDHSGGHSYGVGEHGIWTTRAMQLNLKMLMPCLKIVKGLALPSSTGLVSHVVE